jgi:hypothetical protein
MDELRTDFLRMRGVFTLLCVILASVAAPPALEARQEAPPDAEPPGPEPPSLEATRGLWASAAVGLGMAGVSDGRRLVYSMNYGLHSAWNRWLATGRYLSVQTREGVSNFEHEVSEFGMLLGRQFPAGSYVWSLSMGIGRATHREIEMLGCPTCGVGERVEGETIRIGPRYGLVFEAGTRTGVRSNHFSLSLDLFGTLNGAASAVGLAGGLNLGRLPR